MDDLCGNHMFLLRRSGYSLMLTVIQHLNLCLINIFNKRFLSYIKFLQIKHQNEDWSLTKPRGKTFWRSLPLEWDWGIKRKDFCLYCVNTPFFLSIDFCYSTFILILLNNKKPEIKWFVFCKNKQCFQEEYFQFIFLLL